MNIQYMVVGADVALSLLARVCGFMLIDYTLDSIISHLTSLFCLMSLECHLHLTSDRDGEPVSFILREVGLTARPKGKDHMLDA